MYLAISIILTILAIREVTTHKSSKQISLIVWLVLTVLVCFRYGMGTDYFNYNIQYQSVNAKGSYFQNSLYHGEPGWYIIMLAAKKAGLSFEMFVGIISLGMMILIRRGIERFSPYKFLSYLLLFPTYYMTYCNSAMRQGVVLSVFLGFGVGLLTDGKKWKYIALIIGTTLIHYSALILIMPLFISMLTKKRMSLVWMPFAALLFFLIYRFSAGEIAQFSFSQYIKDSYSIGGIIMRLLLAYMIWLLYVNRSAHDLWERQFYTWYFIGVALFLAFSFTGTFAQRLTMPYKALEVLLIPMLIFNNSKQKKVKVRSNPLVMTLAISVLMNVELVKNINSYLDQGNYHHGVEVWNYPYVSVFNEQDIYRYRDTYSWQNDI